MPAAMLCPDLVANFHIFLPAAMNMLNVLNFASIHVCAQGRFYRKFYLDMERSCLTESRAGAFVRAKIVTVAERCGAQGPLGVWVLALEVQGPRLVQRLEICFRVQRDCFGSQ